MRFGDSFCGAQKCHEIEIALYVLGKMLKKAFTPIVMGLLYWFLEPTAIAQWGRNNYKYHIELNDVEKWHRFFFYFEELLLPYA